MVEEVPQPPTTHCSDPGGDVSPSMLSRGRGKQGWGFDAVPGREVVGPGDVPLKMGRQSHGHRLLSRPRCERTWNPSGVHSIHPCMHA